MEPSISNSNALPIAIKTSRNHARANHISTKPLIIGHRGASAVAPENTLASFSLAFDAGADGIELDVRLARDGVPVVIHDATLRRTGRTSGIVAEMTSAQLVKCDVGSWFNRAHPHLARREFEKQFVPTLAQVLESCSETAGSVYVELKSEDKSSASALVDSVADVIKRLKFNKRSIVVSFDLALLLEMKRRDVSIRTGALFAPARKGQRWRSQNLISAAIDCGADEILPHRLLTRTKLVEKAIQRNLSVAVWTVDDPGWVARAAKLGIKALITNDPAKLIRCRPRS